MEHDTLDQHPMELPSEGMARVIETNHIRCWRYWAGWPNIQWNDESDHAWTLSNIPYQLFNNIFLARLEPERVGDTIETIIERARSHDIPIRWWVGPSSLPADLARHLVAAGFELWFKGLGMAIDLVGPSGEEPGCGGLTIEPVRDEATLKVWCDIIMPIYEFPDLAGMAWFELLAYLGVGSKQPLQHLLARLDGEPVATASLFISGEVAGLSYIGTRPEYQHRGIGTAITLRALLEARGRGCRIGTLYSSAEATGMYRRLGFTPYCEVGCYRWPGKE